jgi:hypothetical protein
LCRASKRPAIAVPRRRPVWAPMEPELVVFASFRAYGTLAILAFESKSSSLLSADSGPDAGVVSQTLILDRAPTTRPESAEESQTGF